MSCTMEQRCWTQSNFWWKWDASIGCFIVCRRMWEVSGHRMCSICRGTGLLFCDSTAQSRTRHWHTWENVCYLGLVTPETLELLMWQWIPWSSRCEYTLGRANFIMHHKSWDTQMCPGVVYIVHLLALFYWLLLLNDYYYLLIIYYSIFHPIIDLMHGTMYLIYYLCNWLLGNLWLVTCSIGAYTTAYIYRYYSVYITVLLLLCFCVEGLITT